MDQLNTYQAKRDLSILLQRVQKGETIIIARHNKPIAELRPIQQNKPKKPRPFGLCAGEFKIPHNFNDPLPPKILQEFYND